MMMRLPVIAILIGTLCSGASADAASGGPASLPASGTDVIADLSKNLEAGKLKLAFDPDGPGFLKSLLRQLNVEESSQILVFSKTSLQHKLIGPETPRAIYFSDSVAVGFVQGSPLLELMVPTSDRGYAFYTMENSSDKPRFVRQEVANCGRCHGADSIDPGLIVASTPVGEDGTAALIFSDGPARLFNFTDQNTPIAERWGGWYVTGTHGDQPHQGNGAYVTGDDGSKREHHVNAQNVLSLEPFFDVRPYLRPTSDIVALMVFEHQARMTNLLLAASATFARTNDLQLAVLDDVVAHMLFVGEAPLSAPVQGNSEFAASFVAKGPRDSKGRSLRELDLQRRLFKYPLSYMIYSAPFKALPAGARKAIYDRLSEVLEGRDTSSRFAGLTQEDRENTLAILRDTRADAGLN